MTIEEYIEKHFGITITDKEIIKIQRFESIHRKSCKKEMNSEYILQPIEKGHAITIRCSECDSKQDIRRVNV